MREEEGPDLVEYALLIAFVRWRRLPAYRPCSGINTKLLSSPAR